MSDSFKRDEHQTTRADIESIKTANQKLRSEWESARLSTSDSQALRAERAEDLAEVAEARHKTLQNRTLLQRFVALFKRGER